MAALYLEEQLMSPIKPQPAARIRCIAAALLISAFPAQFAGAQPPAAATVSTSDAELTTKIDAVLAPHFKPNEPGATVIVTRDGKPLFRKAYGMANIELGVALRPDMSLRLGSITKQFTAVSILMLADQGKLSVDDDITKHLPDYPTQGRKITIEHLLVHTSGIKSYTGMPGYGAGMRADKTVQQMIDTFKNEPFDFEPGDRYQYNNSGYFLLGAIIEKVSGLTYAEFVAKNIFEPLGMKNSGYDDPSQIVPNRAEGYTRKGGQIRHAAYLSMTQPYAAGSLRSSVDDLALWDGAIAAGKLLKPETWKRAFTPNKPNKVDSAGYGYGWSMRDIQGHPAIEHGGAINGFNTYAVRLPQDKVYVAILGNEDAIQVSRAFLGEKIAAIAVGKPYPERKPVTLSEKVLDAYVGVYRIDDKATRTVTREGDTLYSQRSGSRKVPLEPWSETEFVFSGSFTEAKFVKDANGEVTGMIVKQAGKETLTPRVK
jgi:D-alanyl-D-alanine carboxypeptidase